MKNIWIVIILITLCLGLHAEPGATESGIGINIGRFTLKNSSDQYYTYTGYGFETYYNLDIGRLLGIGGSVNSFNFWKVTDGADTVLISNTKAFLGFSILMGPSYLMEFGFRQLDFQALFLAGPSVSMHGIFGEAESFLHMNIGCGVDAKAFIFITQVIKVYLGIGADFELIKLVSDYTDNPSLSSYHLSLGIQFRKKSN